MDPATGLYNYNGTLGYFYNNKIQNIKASPSSIYASINGIDQTNYGTEMYFFNNTITDLENPGADVTLGYDWNMLNGIYLEETANIRGIYNNTIYLNAGITGSQTNYGSSAICVVNLYGVDLRNNILINTSAKIGPEGKTVAIRERNPGLSGFTSNYNNLYAGTPSTKNLIFYDGITSAQTLNDYKTIVYPQELQSKTEMSPFVNITSQPWDVHLKTNEPTQCEEGGVVISSPFPIVSDIDGDPRYPNPGYPFNPSYPPGAPDIGADEIGGISNDLTAPSIDYTPLYNTNSTTNRTLLADIKDPSGIATAGLGLPALYWKINSGAYQMVQGQYLSGSSYSFTFGAGTSIGDIVSYYIAAVDYAPSINVGVFPSLGAGGFTTFPPACSTPPTNPSTYSIVLSIAGTFHVGIDKPYTTLSAAINDLNSKSVSGPLTFILDDNSYPSETFPILIHPNAGSSSVNTVTIRANTGAFPVISGYISSSGLIMLKGVDYLIFDGSDGLSNEQRITFENTSPDYNSFTLGITNDGASDPSTNITIKNCIVKGNNTNVLNETYLIVFNNNASINGGGYNNIIIDHNLLNRAKNGIDINANDNNRNHNITITNNTLGSPVDTDYITRWGIAVRRSDNVLIANNDIMGPASEIGTYACFGITFVYNMTNLKITNNKIHDFRSSSIGCWGIKCDNDNNSTPTEISNNLFYNISAHGMNPGVSQNQANGIMVRQGGNLRIWNNTILLTGDYLYGGDSYAPSSACILFWNLSTVNSDQIDIRNNILQNSMTNSFPNPDPSAWGKAYGIMTTEVVTFSHLDNNDYYIDGYQGQIAQKFCVGGTCLVDFPTLALWQTYTGMEANSLTVDPQFTSQTNLIPTTTLMNNAGVYIPEVPTDYTGKYRSNPCDIGAYEFATDQVLNLKVYLEGAFNSSTNMMNTTLLTTGYLPDTQPYYPALPYFGNNDPTWLYAGTESVSAMPNDVVDWVTVELRDAASAATAGPGTVIPGGTRAALLKSDGTIIGTEANPYLIFAGVPVTQNLFVVINHRNHLAILSSGPVTSAGGIYSWNFTTEQGQAYNNGQKMLATGKYGMIGGDGNGDAQVNALDKTAVWNIQAGKNGYSASDFNMDGEVANPDKNEIWVPNTGTGSSVQF